MRRLWLIGAVALLGGACALWSGVPLGGSGAPGVLCLAACCGCVALGLLRLFRLSAGQGEPDYVPSLWRKSLDDAKAGLLRTNWETGVVVAAAVAEAVHPSRPWHTVVLALLLLGYLLAVHQAESGQPSSALRGQARTVVVGVSVAAAVTGIAELPAAGTGTGAVVLAMAAALAAVLAGSLALPT